MNCNSTPLQLPVEALQKSCPQLQVYSPPFSHWPLIYPSATCTSSQLPGATAAQSDLASQALWKRGTSGTRLPQS